MSSSQNYQASSPDLLRGGSSLPPLAELYIALLDYPGIYWESRMSDEIWPRYAEFESMGLGPIPPMPDYLRASIPEPMSAACILLFVAGFRRRM